MIWRYRTTVLALCVYGFFSIQAARFALSPLVPGILDTFAVSKGTIGLALTGMWAAYALLQYPGGVLGDRFGERRIVLLGLGMVGVGSMAVAIAPTFALFAVCVLLLGGGAGLYFPVVASLLADLFENDGQALGLVAAGSSIAGMVAPAVAAIVAVRYGWRVAVPLVGALVLPVIVLFWRYIRPRSPDSLTQSVWEGLNPTTLSGLLSRPSVAFTLFISFVASFTFQSVFSFLPTFLVEYHSFTTQDAGIAFGGMYLVSAVAQAGMGRVSDVWSRDTAIVISASSVVAGIGVLLLTSGVVRALAGLALVGLGLSMGGVINARFIDNFGEAERGTGLGLVRTLYLLLASTGNVVTGSVADVAGWSAAYGVVAGLLVILVVGIGVNRLLGTGL